eukprot:767521-Hanusia_phi.AAC.4
MVARYTSRYLPVFTSAPPASSSASPLPQTSYKQPPAWNKHFASQAAKSRRYYLILTKSLLKLASSLSAPTGLTALQRTCVVITCSKPDLHPPWPPVQKQQRLGGVMSQAQVPVYLTDIRGVVESLPGGQGVASDRQNSDRCGIATFRIASDT